MKRPSALAPRTPADLAARLRSPLAPRRDVTEYVGRADEPGWTMWRLDCGHLGLARSGSLPVSMACQHCGGPS